MARHSLTWEKARIQSTSCYTGPSPPPLEGVIYCHVGSIRRAELKHDVNQLTHWESGPRQDWIQGLVKRNALEILLGALGHRARQTTAQSRPSGPRHLAPNHDSRRHLGEDSGRSRREWDSSSPFRRTACYTILSLALGLDAATRKHCIMQRIGIREVGGYRSS